MEEETVEIELDDETYYLASCLAELRGVTVDEIVAEAITEHMKKIEEEKTEYDKIPERY